MLQRGTVIMDGVPGVTQVALPPASEQLYVFACSLPGTFWYHSHFKAQYIDGLKGALIVDDPARPALPTDSIVQLTDWCAPPRGARGRLCLARRRHELAAFPAQQPTVCRP